MTVEQLWKLFEETGDINYYLFYKALQREEDRREESLRDDMPANDMN